MSRVSLAVGAVLYAGLAAEFWVGVFPVPREERAGAVSALVLTSGITAALVVWAWRKPSGKALGWLMLIALVQGLGSMVAADWIVGMAYGVDAVCFMAARGFARW